jgi:glycerol-3-phosphate dehydrogenase
MEKTDPQSKLYDVAIIGGGVVGCAIARKLSHFDLHVCLIEAQSDVGMGTSKANTAIFHTGFDAVPGSLEATLLRRSAPLLQEYCGATGIAYQINGALMVAWNAEQLARLPKIEQDARRNGVTRVEPQSADQVYRLESHLGPGAMGGLLIHEEGILCPYSVVLAYAYEARRNGVHFIFNARVHAIDAHAEGHEVSTTGPQVRTRWLVNAAGLYSDDVDRCLDHNRFHVTPRKGELLIYDKFASSLLHHTILPIPTEKTKGVLVCPTVYGNVLLGPTAEDIEDKTDTSTSADGLAGLQVKGKFILPELVNEEVTATYAGLRAATEHKDYQIHFDAAGRYACVGGIRSTGLSASMGISEYVVEEMQSAGLACAEKAKRESVLVPPLGEHQVRPCRDEKRIGENPAYGRIVCHCERVTLGEVQEALRADPAPANLDGLRRRTRCLQGRCQGFYCQSQIKELLWEHQS